MKLTRIGVDLAKNIFQLHGHSRPAPPQGGRQELIGRYIGDDELTALDVLTVMASHLLELV